MTDNQNIRAISLNILIDVMENGEYSHTAIKNVLDANMHLSKQERAFLTRLTEGTIERAIELDYIIEQFSSVKIRKMKPAIRNILRMSVYQIKYMDAIPDSAAINEAVKLVQKRKMTGLKSFVNGVLRNISRNINDIKYPDKSDTELYLSIVYSMPLWIVNKFINEIGIQRTGIAFEKMLHARPVCVRMNVSRASGEQIKKLLEAQNVHIRQSQYYENALYISNYDSLDKIEAFKRGFITVQDISSMMVGMVSGIKKNMRVIDVCAAPGGKTLHAADIMQNTGLIISRDLTEKKTALIDENIKRTGFTNIITQKYNALNCDKENIGKADVVIADLPCSGLGIMGNKNDIKYKITPETIVELCKLQKDILKVVSEYLKPGGVLIYSTCTITKEENADNFEYIRDELKLMPDSLTPFLPDSIGANLSEDTLEKGYLQLIPGIYETDGFFISRFIKPMKAD
ncbi:MAG: 16S rRNA (cytosine(967)-C(5))-methyltransferase RsmB [Eubacterium sp.]